MSITIFAIRLLRIFVLLLINICKMKKLILSLAILVGATLILSQENSEDLNKVSNDDVVTIQSKLQSES